MLFERASVRDHQVATAGRVVEANPAIERMLGYGPGGARRHELRRRSPIPTTSTSPRRRYRGIRRGPGAPPTSTRSDTSAQDGEVIWVRVNGWTDAGAAGSSQVAIAMIEDITQRSSPTSSLQDRANRLELIIATQRDIAAAASGGPRARDAGDRRARPGAHAGRGGDDPPDRGRGRVTRAPPPGSPPRFLAQPPAAEPEHLALCHRGAGAAADRARRGRRPPEPADPRSWWAIAPTSAFRCSPATSRSARSA